MLENVLSLDEARFKCVHVCIFRSQYYHSLSAGAENKGGCTTLVAVTSIVDH